MFWMYHPSPTHETQEAPFRPIPVHIQAQQKHWRCNTHSFTQCIYTHLEKPGSFVRILFNRFSSAFDTIQQHLMASKLLKLDVNPRLILWIVDFLVNHSQRVCHQAALLSSLSVSTGSPQGTVQFPILFTLYTNDCTGTATIPIIKKLYCDSSTIEDLSNSDSVHFAKF